MIVDTPTAINGCGPQVGPTKVYSDYDLTTLVSSSRSLSNSKSSFPLTQRLCLWLQKIKKSPLR
jgi:hypothetical protein